MKNRWIACLLILTLALAALLPAAVAEPTVLSMTLGVNEKYQINTASIPGAEGKQLVFATSNKKVASVSAEGVITGKRAGTAKIAVGYDDTALAVCTVKVMKAPKKIAFEKKLVVVNAGDTQQLSVKLPEKTASTITYESSDPLVATVDDAGKLTAVAAGKSIITAKSFNGKSASCVVAVLAGKAPTSVKLESDMLSLQVKEKIKLTPTLPEGEEAVFAYASANKKIATVSSDGVVTGRKKGATRVLIRTHNGVTAIVNVVVKGKLANLCGCLTNKHAAFLRYARKLRMRRDTTTGDTSSVTYYNSQAALIMTANSCQVSLKPTTSPKYCVEGIDTTMTSGLAASKLLANGWQLADARTVDGVEVRAFTKDGDATHVIIISADGSDIRSIDAVLKW